MRPSPLPALLLALAACTSEKPAPADTGGDTGAVAPCAAGWGAISDPGASLHVRADGDDAGDGSSEAPLATIAAALDRSRADGGLRRIALGPGSYPATLDLFQADADGDSDDGLVIEGCSSGEVTLAAEASEDAVVRASGVVGLELRGFTVSGGTRAIWLWNATTATLEDIHVEDARRLGLVMDGSDTLVDLADVEVRDTAADSDGTFGYGIAVQDATVTMAGGGVWDSLRVGMLVDGGVVTLDGVTVSGTTSDGDGRLGRGLQVQEGAEATLTGGTFADNADAAVFALRAGWLGATGVTLSDTLAATIPDGAGTSGDGIVVTQGDDGRTYPVSSFLAELTDNVVDGAARAGILFDGVTGVVTGNAVTADYEVGGVSIIAQAGSDVSGGDTFAELVDGVDTPLALDVTALDGDDLTAP